VDRHNYRVHIIYEASSLLACGVTLTGEGSQLMLCQGSLLSPFSESMESKKNWKETPHPADEGSQVPQKCQ